MLWWTKVTKTIKRGILILVLKGSYWQITSRSGNLSLKVSKLCFQVNKATWQLWNGRKFLNMGNFHSIWWHKMDIVQMEKSNQKYQNVTPIIHQLLKRKKHFAISGVQNLKIIKFNHLIFNNISWFVFSPNFINSDVASRLS